MAVVAPGMNCWPQQWKDRPQSYGPSTYLKPTLRGLPQPKVAMAISMIIPWKEAGEHLITDWDQLWIHTPKREIFQDFVSSISWFDWSHLILFRVHARSFKISFSSWRLYWPSWRVWRKKWLSMILVNASANWAPLCTHLNVVPSAKKIFGCTACNCVLNSWHAGGAVLVTRSYSDLQSVTAIDGSALKVAVAYVGGKVLRVLVGFLPICFGISDPTPE